MFRTWYVFEMRIVPVTPSQKVIGHPVDWAVFQCALHVSFIFVPGSTNQVQIEWKSKWNGIQIETRGCFLDFSASFRNAGCFLIA